MGRYLRPALLVADWLLFNAMFLLVFYGMHADATAIVPLWQLLLLVNLSFVPVLVHEDQHHSHRLRAIQIDNTLRASLEQVGLHALFFLSLMELCSVPTLGLPFYVTYYLVLSLCMCMWGAGSRRLIKRVRRRGYNYLRVAIVGTNSTAMRLYEAMNRDTGFGYKVLGFFDESPKPGFHGRYAGDISQLDKFVKEEHIDQIYFTRPGHGSELTTAMKVSDDNVIDFFYVPQITHYVARDFQVDNIGSVPVLTIRRNPLRKTANALLKRTFDIVVSGTFLLFYPLIYVPVALAIKRSSPGPVYFKQERTGYKGKSFTCLKFRTMRVNAHADISQATANDPRKTRLGEFLRHYSIDELPQFINVFKGNMSVVGPRPHMIRHTEEYTKIVDKYMVRHMVKPGITGWAQVNGFRGPTDEVWKMEKRVEYDMWYIEHWSLLLDFKIVARTIYNALAGEKNAV